MGDGGEGSYILTVHLQRPSSIARPYGIRESSTLPTAL